MTEAPRIETGRLVLRHHRLEDYEPFAAFFESDASRYVGGPLPRRRTWHGFAGDVGSWSLMGFGAWAIEDKATAALLGQVALSKPAYFPERELGWIVFPAHQRRGYATEAALAARAFAYATLGWKTAVSYIDPANAASIALAGRLGAAVAPDAKSFDPRDLVFRHPSPEALR